MTDRFVYFARRIDDTGPVKIGCSAVPMERLAVLMQWAPYPLKIAATIKGDERLERAFHSFFREHWSHREWFREADEINETIRLIRLGEFDTATLPPGKRIWPATGGARKWTEGQKLACRVDRKLYSTGVLPCPEVRAAAARAKAAGNDVAEQDRAIIEPFLRDPLQAGEPAPYAWAQEAFAKYAAKRGLAVAPRSRAA